ncbi:MAG: alpha-1,4-glucan--maltose-1-phosphate maltosyltransferase [Candidatus Rokubacteria bacterium RIFCSPLOWO2_02_FULL_73_56]|nr:MAG: alpha-1,4-glucan--maltose-1-phosphate maltosyltransferase [Candidatus Rokubacteria bacterium RIFCSPLOWO2_02_FULL_73_56]OGL23217.1 MAG: alpha-1,4-glucan--maltose-1-phosphate maltosyltransferase [Candidatus Rokubacteria bacterium RIFCSPLOWO2_12_FULL_73_47]
MPASRHDLKRTVIIEAVAPTVDAGRYAVKREIGAVVEVSADIFKEGHDVLLAFLEYRRAGETAWRETPMRHVDNDRWVGAFTLDAVGRWAFALEALADPFRSWLADLVKRLDAGQEVASDLLEGAALVRAAAGRARGPAARELRDAAERLARAAEPAAAVATARDGRLALLMDAHLDRSTATRSAREYEVVADVERARFAAWYEMFPRSGVPGRHGTFKDAEAQLPRIARMGFDVVYLPPIHPVGRTHRKGRNNSLTAAPGDPGSPWAIGGEAGGHTAVHPELGTLDDFERFVARAHALGLEVALDFAIQCSPDHPWAREHPEWFFHRPDGTIKHAENPPKKYQDIYPVNFYGPEPQALWDELKRVLEFWIGHGVRTFRVDNPHTKPVRFWEWLIREIKDECPDVIFLAEAFTRPKMMQVLAKAGFTQSYTYFTWRNAKQELIDYFTEITQPPVADYFRGHLWPNTPDILHATLQTGGRPAFRMRLLLAATLSSLYGIYSGYELCENQPVAEGSEEYLNSEKYELKVRDWDAPGSITDLVTTLNRIRREHPALQRSTNLRFYPCDNPSVLWYGKMTEAGDDVIFVAVSLDPVAPQAATVEVPLEALGLAEDAPYRMRDLLGDAAYEWRGRRGWVRLDPQGAPAHVFLLER